MLLTHCEQEIYPCSSLEIGMLAGPLLARKKAAQEQVPKRRSYPVSEPAMHTDLSSIKD